jgi:hypothetical protein
MTRQDVTPITRRSADHARWFSGADGRDGAQGYRLIPSTLCNHVRPWADRTQKVANANYGVGGLSARPSSPASPDRAHGCEGKVHPFRGENTLRASCGKTGSLGQLRLQSRRHDYLRRIRRRCGCSEICGRVATHANNARTRMGIEGLGAHGRCRLPEDRGCSQNGSPEDSRKEKFYPAGTLLSEPLSNCEGRRRLVVWVTKWHVPLA